MRKKTTGPASKPISLLHLSNLSSEGDKASPGILLSFLFNPCAYELTCKKDYNAYRDNDVAETKEPSQYNIQEYWYIYAPRPRPLKLCKPFPVKAYRDVEG